MKKQRNRKGPPAKMARKGKAGLRRQKREKVRIKAGKFV